MSSGTARLGLVAWPGLSRFWVIVLPAYTAAIFAAEIVTALVDARWGVGLHVALLWALFLHFSWAKETSEAKLLLALCLAPLIRILSLAMPLEDVGLVYWFLIVSAPVIVAAFLVARALGLTRYDLGLTVRAIPVQLLVGITGVGLGIVEYLILKPDALIDELTWQQVWLPALILLVATGFGEELLFRGVMQSALADVHGKMAILWVAVVFAALHVGHKSAPDVAFAFIVGLFFGWVVAKTRSLVGVSLCHGLLNVMLYVIVPFTVLSPAGSGVGPPRLWTAWVMAGLTLAAVGAALLGAAYLLATVARGARWRERGIIRTALGCLLRPADIPPDVQVSGIPSFQSLLDLNRALNRTPAVGSTTVRSYYSGEATITVTLSSAVRAEELVTNWSRHAAVTMGISRDEEASVLGVKVRPQPSDCPLTFQVSGVPSFQGLLDLNRALNRTPAVRSTTVHSYYSGEATVTVAISSAVQAEELVANWSRLAAVKIGISPDEEASVLGVKVRLRPSTT